SVAQTIEPDRQARDQQGGEQRNGDRGGGGGRVAGDLERGDDMRMRCAVPPRKRLAAQRRIRQGPSVEVSPCGRAGRLDIVLIEHEREDVRGLAADRELDLKLLMVER